jgi:hypothetical protein
MMFEVGPTALRAASPSNTDYAAAGFPFATQTLGQLRKVNVLFLASGSTQEERTPVQRFFREHVASAVVREPDVDLSARRLVHLHQQY